MVVLPRAAVRACVPVFRKLARGPTPLVVGVTAGPGGVRLRCGTADVAVEYHHPGPADPADLAVPLAAVAAAGTAGDITVEPRPGGRVRVKWQKIGVPHEQEFDAGPAPALLPDFPADARPNPPRLLEALAAAAETAAKEGGRYALHRVRLRGGGQVAATDGKVLVIDTDFEFGWVGDRLVPAARVFAAKELEGDEPVTVAEAGGRVLVRAGPWTVSLAVDLTGRFPDVEGVVPRAGRCPTTWRLPAADVATLKRFLAAAAKDEGGGDAAVLIDLGPKVSVRSTTGHPDSPAGLVLSAAGVVGDPVRFAVEARYLAKGLGLGFDAFDVAGPGKPLAARDGTRTFVCLTTEPGHDPEAADDAAAEVKPEVPRVASGEPAGSRPWRPAVVGASSATPPAAAWSWRAWAGQFRSLTASVRRQLRRDEY